MLVNAQRPSRFSGLLRFATGLLVALFALLAAAPVAAIDNLAKPASIVVDARSGEVLFEHNGGGKRYPASVTKVMTLYVLFEELEAGRLSLKSKLTVSKHAASARPTKLGLKAGSTISVEDAIKSLVTISANDMARTIAEAVSGSEEAFARRMTKTAKKLGMKSTNYANASGWPDPNNITTVRDQARLGIAIQQRFPKYYHYFQTKSFAFNGRTYRSHNHVLGYMGAVDGLKTGWTNSSGSTILTAARLNGRELVVAVFGYSGHASRDAKVRELVKAYLPGGSKGKGQSAPIEMAPPPTAMEAPVIVAVVPLPLPSFRRGGQVMVAEEQPVVVASLEDRIADLLESDVVAIPAAFTPAEPMDGTLGAPPAMLGQTRPSAPLDFMEPDAPEAQVASVAPQSGGSGRYVIQIGAAPSEGNASELLGDAAEQVDGLEAYRGFTERFESGGNTYFRARFGGFGSEKEAAGLCNKLEDSGFPCMVAVAG